MGSLPGVSGAVKKEEEDVEEDDILGVQLRGGKLTFACGEKGEGYRAKDEDAATKCVLQDMAALITCIAERGTRSKRVRVLLFPSLWMFFTRRSCTFQNMQCQILRRCFHNIPFRPALLLVCCTFLFLLFNPSYLFWH